MSWRAELAIWDAGSGRLCDLTVLPREALPRPFVSGGGACFSPDGATFVMWTGEYIVAWDARAWEPRATVQVMAKGFTVMDVAYSPDGRFVVAVGHECGVSVWDAATWERLRSEGQYAYAWSAAVSPDSHVAAVGYHGRGVHLWSLPDLECVGMIGGIEAPRALAWEPGGGRLAAACGDGYLRAWDPAGDCVVFEADADPQHAPQSPGASRVVFAPGGACLATASDDRLRLWHPGDGSLACEQVVARDRVTDVVFAPAGSLVATADGSGRVNVWAPSA